MVKRAKTGFSEEYILGQLKRYPDRPIYVELTGVKSTDTPQATYYKIKWKVPRDIDRVSGEIIKLQARDLNEYVKISELVRSHRNDAIRLVHDGNIIHEDRAVVHCDNDKAMQKMVQNIINGEPSHILDTNKSPQQLQSESPQRAGVAILTGDIEKFLAEGKVFSIPKEADRYGRTQTPVELVPYVPSRNQGQEQGAQAALCIIRTNLQSMHNSENQLTVRIELIELSQEKIVPAVSNRLQVVSKRIQEPEQMGLF